MLTYYKGDLVLIDYKYQVVGRECKYFIIHQGEVLLVKESELVFINNKERA